MTDVFVAGSNIFSPLGSTAADNYAKVRGGVSGIKNRIEGFPVAKIGLSMPKDLLENFELICKLSIHEALQHTNISLEDERTAFILSTTKGNINFLEKDRGADVTGMQLFNTAQKIASEFKTAATPLVVSNACISGLLAILIGQRLIRSGQYDHAVICGADLLTQFVFSGFRSFQAVSAEPCRPFDAARNGITLGEGAATIVLTKDTSSLKGSVIRLGEGASRNDANHISGPSRTGEELASAITKAMEGSGVKPEELAFISAHGTATLYNDEMEAKAFHVAGVQDVPVNSLKGYYGHTLGAAGLIESIISMQSLLDGTIIPTLGFETLGVSVPLNVSNTLQTTNARHFLKTTSGFGGCNAAMVFSKVEL